MGQSQKFRELCRVRINEQHPTHGGKHGQLMALCHHVHTPTKTITTDKLWVRLDGETSVLIDEDLIETEDA